MFETNTVLADTEYGTSLKAIFEHSADLFVQFNNPTYEGIFNTCRIHRQINKVSNEYVA